MRIECVVTYAHYDYDICSVMNKSATMMLTLSGLRWRWRRSLTFELFLTYIQTSLSLVAD